MLISRNRAAGKQNTKPVLDNDDIIKAMAKHDITQHDATQHEVTV